MGRCSRSLSSLERRRRRASPFRECFERPGRAVDAIPPVREGIVEPYVVAVEVYEVARQAFGTTKFDIEEVVHAACVGKRRRERRWSGTSGARYAIGGSPAWTSVHVGNTPGRRRPPVAGPSACRQRPRNPVFGTTCQIRAAGRRWDVRRIGPRSVAASACATSGRRSGRVRQFRARCRRRFRTQVRRGRPARRRSRAIWGIPVPAVPGRQSRCA